MTSNAASAALSPTTEADTDAVARRLHPDIAEIRFSEQQIAARVAELGRQISADYEGKDLVLVGILTGAALFLSDLVRHIEVPLSFDFVAVQSYGEGTKSSGVVRILKDLDEAVESRHVLVVEDVTTEQISRRLAYLLENLRSRRAASVRVCTLLDKTPRERKATRKSVGPDYTGFEIDERYVVGYGLDYAGKYRSLPYIGVLKPIVYGGG
jgi:hypoxanthine phosphoribosyltransferase